MISKASLTHYPINIYLAHPGHGALWCGFNQGKDLCRDRRPVSAACSVEGVEAAQGSRELAHTHSSGGERVVSGLGGPGGTSGLTLPPHCLV